MKIVLSILLFVSIVTNCYLYNEGNDGERAENRPIIESFIIGANKNEITRDQVIFELLLLDSLNSGFFSPLHEDFKIDLVSYFKEVKSNAEIEQMYDDLFADIDKIYSENSQFIAKDKLKFTVIGGCSLIERDYSSSECSDVITKIKGHFFNYLESTI